MAKRRCISVDIYEDYEFLDLSNDAKVLYTAFMLHTDDDGFVVNHRTVMRLFGARQEDFDELLETGFLMEVGGVVVIKHWYVHNRIQPTRKTDTIYKEQLRSLYVNDYKEYERL